MPKLNASIPPLFLSPMRAPALMRVRITTRSHPLMPAYMSGVVPLASGPLTSAPLASSSSTVSRMLS